MVRHPRTDEIMVKSLTDDEMYDIVSRRDARFDGVFFFGAYDSEVYCLPSCKARTPLRRKIRFTPPVRRRRPRDTDPAGAVIRNWS